MKVSAAEVPALTAELRAALDGGPAVWPVPGPEGLDPLHFSTDPTVDDAIALVVETSGSTDAPKRVLLPAEALTASADATHDALGSTGQWLLALPGHYIAGAQVIVRGILAGTETVAVPPGHFEPTAFAEASARLAPRVPHYTSLVPVQLTRLLDAAERDAFVAAAVRSFDAVLVGGQALAPALAERAADAGVHVVRTYGSSETAGGCVYDGRPLDAVRVRTAADGVVELSGPMLAAGYLGDADRTAAAFPTDADGTRWYRTGDLGELDRDGRLRIRGRADDLIVSGGVKVALGEVERAIRGIRAVPSLAGAVVVGAPDAEWGERPVVVTTGASVSSRDLAAATDAAGLPPAARPVRVIVLDELPLLASGKPDRRAIRALAAAAGGVAGDAAGDARA
ncbi:AMP-binding protein [Agromyces agglutinans]|uniref:AMP-binding protein n=1 Tax=Agromyces agglutinans TaxID=2662258 RepID=UPI0028AD7B2C|nr:AMP-binding protein [Agromyces agglutinans]